MASESALWLRRHLLSTAAFSPIERVGWLTFLDKLQSLVLALWKREPPMVALPVATPELVLIAAMLAVDTETPKARKRCAKRMRRLVDKLSVGMVVPIRGARPKPEQFGHQDAALVRKICLDCSRCSDGIGAE